MSTPNGDAAPGSYYEIEWYCLRMQFASVSGLGALPEPDSESLADDGGVYAEPPSRRSAASALRVCTTADWR